MRHAIFSLAGGIGASVWLGLESVAVIQGIGSDTTITGVFAVQIGFLLSAAGMLLYAGRTLGQWQTTQKTLVAKVEEIDNSNLELRLKVAMLEGVLHMMERREGRPGLWDEEDAG